MTNVLPLSRATLAVFATAETMEGAPIVDTWRRLTADLDEEEARQLPLAIASILDPLRADRDRFALALQIISTFDLVETLPKLATMAEIERDPDVALTAALLASNPTVSGALRNRIANLG